MTAGLNRPANPECVAAALNAGWVRPDQSFVLCDWFALCGCPQSMWLSHPILVQVATCRCCAARVERMKSNDGDES